MFDLSDFYTVPAFVPFYHVNPMDSISDVPWVVLPLLTPVLSVCKGDVTGRVFGGLFDFFPEGNKWSLQH